MICYLDTSALAKLYIEENGSDLVRAKVALSSLVSTSRIAYVEAMAAFSRYQREGAPSEAMQKIVSHFRLDWPKFLSLEVAEPLVFFAGELVQQHVLRGFDAIHLASALYLAEQLDGEELEVGCWDSRLWLACREAGLATFPAECPGKI